MRNKVSGHAAEDAFAQTAVAVAACNQQVATVSCGRFEQHLADRARTRGDLVLDRLNAMKCQICQCILEMPLAAGDVADC